MKKEYMTPWTEVIKLQQVPAILSGSTFPPGYGYELGAPEFNNDDMQEMQDLLFGE